MCAIAIVMTSVRLVIHAKTVHFSKAQVLWFLGHQISWVSDSVCDFSPWASSAMEVAKGTKFGTKAAYGIRMMPELQIHA